ncbi:MAG TPA: hypothetical protein VFO54_07565 [Chryseosolibacter sp.]|nr:hypothetical protein [Chryseosolibacter sp.]
MYLWSCSTKTQDSHDHHHEGEEEVSDWKEMDEFHLIMAETFHPYKDSANLEPVKTRAGELMEAADRWSSASLPEKVDNDTVRKKLQQLKSEARSLAESVSSADDEEIGEKLTRLHDTFHEIQETWYGGH